MYIAIDGDHIGAKVEELLLKNLLDDLGKFAFIVNNAFKAVQDKLIDEGAILIYSGGDSILVKIVASRDTTLALTESAKAMFIKQTGVTFSAGIGKNALEAYLALKYAKSSGRNKISDFNELSQRFE